MRMAGRRDATAGDRAVDARDHAGAEPQPVADRTPRGDAREIALVLGAGSGLGREIVRVCHARGWRAIAVGSSLPDSGGAMDDIVRFRCDLARADDVEVLQRKLGRAFSDDKNLSDLTHVFWVAGTWWKGTFAEQRAQSVERLIDVNLRNPLRILHELWRVMVDTARPGHPRTFTAIASTSGVRARPHEAVYAATKYAQVGFMRSLGQENTNPHARVALFLPGGMRTHLFDRGGPKPDAYDTFMDPAKVAVHIVTRVAGQTASYFEETIERDGDVGRTLR